MKRIALTTLKNISRVFGVLTLFTVTTVGSVFAGTLTKTFEFGPGTAQSGSHTRAFPIPCGWGVSAKVMFRRDYNEGKTVAESQNDVPIKIDFKEPDLSPEQHGPIIETKSVTAKGTDQMVEFKSNGFKRGCNLPWRVTVHHANDDTPLRRVSGSITLQLKWPAGGFFRPSDANRFAPGESKIVDGVINGLGLYTFTGDWKPWGIGSLPAITKLKFELIDPSGTVVASDDGFPYDTTNPCCTGNKLAIVYNFTDCKKVGDWKLKITNVDIISATDISWRIKVTNDFCP